MNKVVLFCYHKNISKIYNKEWIDQYRDSILNQTFKEFDIFEINYGITDERIFEHSVYDRVELPSFIQALNFLFFKAIIAGYDCAANSNVDDWFSVRRLEKQLPYIESGYDVVSSNFSLVQDDKITLTHSFDRLNIAEELSNNHNVIAHPCVMYSKRFMENNRYVPEQQPLEDLMMWQRTIKNGYRFIILPEMLCYHRLHENSVCQSENK